MLYKVKIIFIVHSCKLYSSCFSCINDYKCIWNSGKCDENNDNSIIKLYNNSTNTIQKSSLKKCFEERKSETLVYVNKYCGILEYDYEEEYNKALIISIPKNDNLYGANPLYCEYTINNYEKIKSFSIETKKKWGFLYMRIEYMESSEDNEFILDNEEKYVINKPEKIKIIFYSNDIKDSPPFSVKITDVFTPVNIVIIIIIIICALLGLIFLVLIIMCIRKQRRNMAIIINDNRNYIIDINNGGTTTERNELINYLNKLKIYKFKDIKDKSINFICPIEMTAFDDNSEVIFTTCHHTFHYNCLKEYINRNINLKELKCFICNKILFKYNSN